MNALAQKPWTETAPQTGELPSWAQELKQKAWQTHQDLPAPLPLQRNLRKQPKFDLANLQLAQVVETPFESLKERLDAWQWEGHKTLLHQGQLIKSALLDEIESQGVILCQIEEAIKNHPDLVQAHLGQIAEMTKANSLNLAHFTGGSFIYVPKGVSISLPLYVLQALAQDNQAFVLRHLIVLESQAKLTLMHDMFSETQTQSNWISEVTEVALGQGANLCQSALQDWGREMNAYSHYAYNLKRDAHLTALHISSGSQYHENQVRVNFNEPGAEAKLLGLNNGEKDQYFHQNTHQMHYAPHTQSDLKYHTVLNDTSYSFFNGMIYVAEEGQYTNSGQVHKGMLLSPEARVDAIPNLEVFADDVLSGHGAAVGSLDQDQLFYLMSRGFDKNIAESLLVEGFMEAILAEFPDQDLKLKIAGFLSLSLLQPLDEVA